MLLTIQENICFYLENYSIEVVAHLSTLMDVHYFQVIIHNLEESNTGLLRIGSPHGGLGREMQIRQRLTDHKMLSPLLAYSTIADIEVNVQQAIAPTQEEVDEEYLPEEYYEEILAGNIPASEKLFLLSLLPSPDNTLATWLEKAHSFPESLLLASQMAQLCRYIYQWEWCVVALLPEYVKMGTPIQIYDLTGVYELNSSLDYGFVGKYHAPELNYGNKVSENMSTYMVCSVLHQAIFQEPAPEVNFSIPPIPRIHQILTTGLSPIAYERFSLAQLVTLLVNTRKLFLNPHVSWEVASATTVGLSLQRLQNEDNYGIKQNISKDGNNILLAVLADGMGGMQEGEKASQLAVKTLLDANCHAIENPQVWLQEHLQKANYIISRSLRDGGTTASVVLAIDRELSIAHVGDSRIFLLRNNCMCQLSEDHSLVGVLLASGEITYEESLDHQDRHMLVKYIGSSSQLNQGYLQDLSHFDRGVSLTLQDQDIIILCSDGVWDVINPNRMWEIFLGESNLHIASQSIIQEVLNQGAPDNATIIILKCHITSQI